MAVALFGSLVAFDSLGHDIGWNPNGPGAGYFPFRVGLLLVATSALVFAQAARGPADEVFATGHELGRSLSVFWPAVALVAAMSVLGCYVPSVLYIAWMMQAHGSYTWLRSLATGALAMVALFAVFEWWFQVPLAKGPLESLLGIY